MRSLIQTYALAVCFVTLMCLVVALGIGIYDVVQIAAPRFTFSYYEPYQSNEAFIQHDPAKAKLSDDEITRARERGFRDAITGERRRAMQSAVFVFIILAIDIVVFAAHWRIANRVQPSLQPSSPA